MNSAWLSQPFPNTLEVNRVLRNTYFMLSLTLLCSAIFAGMAMAVNARFFNPFLFIIVALAFPFALQALRNSVWGIVLTFAYTAFMGWAIGPLLNTYIHNFSNGPQLIMMALGGTGLIFLGLSAIALNPKRDFSKLAPFIFVGFIVAIVLMLVGLFVHMAAFQISVSILFSIISGAVILFQTNAIIHGGERNYLIATVNLYVSIINIFLTLLHLLSIFGGNRNN
jgi:modulator of FtsH protease